MTTAQLDFVRNWIVDNIMRNPDIMFSPEIRNDKMDLAEVIASIYELLHREVTGHTYNYMYHWANKCGACLENDHIFNDLIERENKMKLDEIKKTLAEVQNMCKETIHCDAECPFYKENARRFSNCILNEWPENWLLDQINEKKGGK